MLEHLPNVLTALRIAAVPVLAWLAIVRPTSTARRLVEGLRQREHPTGLPPVREAVTETEDAGPAEEERPDRPVLTPPPGMTGGQRVGPFSANRPLTVSAIASRSRVRCRARTLTCLGVPSRGLGQPHLGFDSANFLPPLRLSSPAMCVRGLAPALRKMLVPSLGPHFLGRRGRVSS